MTIENAISESITISDLVPGEAFSHSGNYYIVTEYKNSAVNLKTGEVKVMDRSNILVKVKAKVIIQATEI